MSDGPFSIAIQWAFQRAWLRRSDASGKGYIGVKDYGGAAIEVYTTSSPFTPLAIEFRTGASSRSATIWPVGLSVRTTFTSLNKAEPMQLRSTARLQSARYGSHP